MWYAKMYFSREKEIFEYDAMGMQDLPSVHRELPFLESLLSFLELDDTEIPPMLARISGNWEQFSKQADRQALTDAMVELGVLAERHIYFRLLYTRCYACISNSAPDQAEIAAISAELKASSKLLPDAKMQAEKFLKAVLDVDSAGREPQKQAAKNLRYTHSSAYIKDENKCAVRPAPQALS